MRRELDSTVVELNQFRRASQQALREAYEEIREHVGEAGSALSAEAGKLSGSTSEIRAALAEITEKLKEMQMPEEVIAIKLSPVSNAFAASVEAFGEQATTQAAELTKVLEKLYELQKERRERSQLIEPFTPICGFG